MIKNKLTKITFALIFLIGFLSCNEDDDASTDVVTDDTTWTITVGAFTLDNGTYTATGNELIFDSKQECQSWNRSAQGDNHDSETHLHYNAAANVLYNNSSVTFSWTEYGPEIDQSSIDSTCSNGTDGVDKTVNDTSYYQDKPNLYLKIISVVEN